MSHYVAASVKELRGRRKPVTIVPVLSSWQLEHREPGEIEAGRREKARRGRK